MSTNGAPSGNPDDLLTTQEVGQLLLVHQQTVAQWVREGLLPAVKVRRRYGIRRSDLETWRLHNGRQSGELAEEDLLTVKQTAVQLQVWPATVRRWIRKGLLPAVQLGKNWHVRRRDLEAWYESKRER